LYFGVYEKSKRVLE
jgi:Mitochondrial carrier protein